MKSTSRSSGKGKLKLVIITSINRHFLVKKDKFYHYIILCTAVVCRQIMVAKTILVKCKAKKKARGDELTAGITS